MQIFSREAGLREAEDRAYNRARTFVGTREDAKETIESIYQNTIITIPEIAGEWVQIGAIPTPPYTVRYGVQVLGHAGGWGHNSGAGPIFGQEVFFDKDRGIIWYELPFDNAEQHHRARDQIESWVRMKLSSTRIALEEHNGRIREAVPKIIEHKLQQHEAKLAEMQSAGIELGFDEVALRLFEAPLQQAPIRVEWEPPTPEQLSPRLSDHTYALILSAIERMASIFERAPTAFGQMEEEHLRWILLVPLNAQFSMLGTAHGEAFHAHGKTDILVTVDNVNIFIGECKFWDGKESFNSALDQALGYTTVRDQRICLLLFVRNKDFESVIRQIPGLEEENAQIMSRPSVKGSKVSFIGRKDEMSSSLQVDVLFFHVPV